MGRTTFKNRKTGGEDQENRIRYYTFMSYLTCNQFKHLDFKLSSCYECYILSFGWFPASEFYVLMFQNFVSSIFNSGVSRKNSSTWHHLWRWNWQSVLKCQHIKFRHWGITQNKEYNSLNICFASSVAIFRSAKEPVYLKPSNLNYKRNFSIPKVFCLSKFLCATQL